MSNVSSRRHYLLNVGTTSFRRCLRLTGKNEFRRVFEQPERSFDDYFTVLARSNQLQYPRLGLAVSKKSIKLAVSRNRIKRLIRESFRHHQQLLPGVDIVVISRSQVDRQNNSTLLNALRNHWLRLIKRCTKY